MRHRPEVSEQGVEFDLVGLESEMRLEPAFVQNGHTARTLVRLPDLRVVLIVMQGGSRMTEHVARETATIQVLSGQVCLRVADRVVELPAGRLLMLPAGLRHDVEATSESAFLLTLGHLAEKV
jgi:quercetin dioxygenase-like cupin family protein